MALHKVNKKWNTTNLLSNGKEIKFRPFTVGEQKNIIIRKIRKGSLERYLLWRVVKHLDFLVSHGEVLMLQTGVNQECTG